jgi:hypothetical protein
MNLQSSMSATWTGLKNSPEDAGAPTSKKGAQLDIQAALDRILARVPPILTLPRAKERCPWTGQSRTSLLELIAPCERNGFKPCVQAIYCRSHKHAVRGRWLIPAENLFRHLLSLSENSIETYLRVAQDRRNNKGSVPIN